MAMTDASYLAGEILRDAGGEWDLDETAESIAVKYVRHLEARCAGLAAAVAARDVIAWDMLGRFPSQVQIARWEKQLGGGGD
jgi:hypothetical protein